jgi:hypothetical protein
MQYIKMITGFYFRGTEELGWYTSPSFFNDYKYLFTDRVGSGHYLRIIFENCVKEQTFTDDAIHKQDASRRTTQS